MAKRDLHDAFFKRVFGRADLAADVWRRLLPAEVFDLLDVERAERVDTEQIDALLRSRRADLIFRVPLRGRPGRCAFVFLLMEHQSTPDPLMPFRVLCYGLGALANYVVDHKAEHGRAPRRLPTIIPMVVYQGARPWTGPRRLSEVFDLPPEAARLLGAHLPEMELLIDDLCRGDDTTSAVDNPLTTAARMVMRYVRGERDPAGFLEGWVAHLDRVADDPEAWALVEVLASYLYDASDRLDPDDIVEAVQSAPRRHPEAMMNLAEKFEERGRLKGIEQGIEKGIERGHARGARKVLIRLLQMRFGELSPATIERLEGADADTLERWAERVLSASRLADVLEG